MVLLEMSHVYLHYYQFDRAKVKWKRETHTHTADKWMCVPYTSPTRTGVLWKGSDNGRNGSGLDRCELPMLSTILDEKAHIHTHARALLVFVSVLATLLCTLGDNHNL